MLPSKYVSTGLVVVFAAIGLVLAAMPASAVNVPGIGPAHASLTPSGPIVLDGKDGTTLEGLQVTSTVGPCIVIKNSRNITLRNSEVGPCRGLGVEVISSSDVKIVDNYVHPEFPVGGCCDSGDGIFAHQSSQLLIQGNVVAFGESNIELLGVSDSQVVGNFTLNPQGPMPRGSQIQVWSYGSLLSSNLTIANNFTLSSSESRYGRPENQTDGINVGYVSGASITGNYVQGGHFPSGCGLAVDDSANSVQARNNVFLETGQCGIGVGDGSNGLIDGNKVYGHGLNRTDVGNTAVYVWQQYLAACGPVTISNNTAALIRPDGSLSSWWKGSGCDPTTVRTNVWDEAAVSGLTPVETKLPSPPIPPEPNSIPATSPFTTWPLPLTPTATPAVTPTLFATVTPARSPTTSPSATPTRTPMGIPSATASPTRAPSPTATISKCPPGQRKHGGC